MSLKTKDPAMVSSGHDRISNDAYFTIDSWMTEILAKELLPYNVSAIWEPACGAGHMVEVLMDVAPTLGSDVVEHEKKTDFTFEKIDFLNRTGTDVVIHNMRADGFLIEAIVTNPPYEKKTCEAFVRRAVSFLVEKNDIQVVAMLLRNDWDAAGSRRDLFRDNTHFTKKIILTNRPVWFYDTKAAPRFSYAWYIWTRNQIGKPTISWRGKSDVA